MILLAALLAMQAAPPADPQGDIVVTGRRLQRLKRLNMTTRRDRGTGATRCVFKRRSGDPMLDEAVCNAVLACVPNVQTVDEMKACIAPTMDRLVADDVPWQTNAARKGGR